MSESQKPEPTRRRFSAEYKRRIVAEAEQLESGLRVALFTCERPL